MKRRQERRIEERKSKELYDLTVKYIFDIQDKNKKEVDEIYRIYNSEWLTSCKVSRKRKDVHLNPDGFKQCIKNKAYINQLREALGLKPPLSNSLLRFFRSLFLR